MNLNKVKNEITKSICKQFELDGLPEDIIFIAEGEEIVFDTASYKLKLDNVEFGLAIAYEENGECNFLINFGEVSDMYKVFRAVNRFNCYTSYDLKCFVDDDNVLMISSVYNDISISKIDDVLEDFIEKISSEDTFELVKEIVKNIK